MKKLLVLLLAGLLVLSGCSSTVVDPQPTEEVTADNTKDAQVVIIGAGAAGLSAAIEAVSNGAQSVVILEKTSATGGSLNYTSGSMSGAETIIQEIDGIEDTKESFVEDILKNGAGLGNKELIEAFVEEDVDAINWLWENGLSDNTFGVDRATGTMSVFAPEHALYSQKRTYKAQPDDKTKYKSAAHEILDTVLATMPEITIEYQTEALQLVANDKGQVLSVLAENKINKETTLYTAEKGIIMATGGYSGNSVLLGQFAEYGADYLVGGPNSADGYGIYMMQEVGAKVDPEVMTYIPTFPMGMEEANGPGSIRPDYMFKNGAISINTDGLRFTDETNEVIEEREIALEEQPGAIMYDIFTDNIIDATVANNSSIFWNFYYAEGMPYHDKVVKANSIEELAEKLGVSYENLNATIEAYNENVENQTTDEFGRQFTEDSLNPAYNVSINKIEGETYYAIPQRALCIMTLGGVEVNTDGQVLDVNGTVIPGLYAAGEVVGGIWGRFVSGGTGVMGPIVFGRLAARSLMNSELTEGYKLQASMNTINKDVFVKEVVETESRFDMTTALTDGEYEATVDGQEGPMTVKVVIADGKIAEVVVVSNQETQSIAGPAIELIPTQIVETNSVDVDVLSGATLTSNRIMDAVTECLKQAAK